MKINKPKGELKTVILLNYGLFFLIIAFIAIRKDSLGLVFLGLTLLIIILNFFTNKLDNKARKTLVFVIKVLISLSVIDLLLLVFGVLKLVDYTKFDFILSFDLLIIIFGIYIDYILEYDKFTVEQFF
jgi:hypothetical protein